MKKNMFLSVLLAILLVASNAFGFGTSVVDNAKNLYSKTDYKMAISVILGGLQDGKIPEKEMTEAYDILGQSYKKLGNHSEARDAFRKAVITNVESYREGQQILYLDANQIKQAEEFILKAAAENPQARKNMAKDIAQLAHNNLSGNLNDAEKLFDLAIRLDKSYENQAFDAFFKKGKAQKGKEAEKFADKAVKFAGNQKAKENVGKLYLRTAAELWPNDGWENVKSKAIPLVGINFVSEVFPAPEVVTVFEKTFDWDDAFNDFGQFYVFTFGDDDIKVGDKVEIIANIKNQDAYTGKEIGVYRGKGLTPEWRMSKNGKITHEIAGAPKGIKYMIGMNSRKDLEVTVKITRKEIILPKKDIGI